MKHVHVSKDNLQVAKKQATNSWFGNCADLRYHSSGRIYF